MPAFDLEQILLNPDMSPWLRMALTTAFEHDPIDVAADAAALLEILNRRVAATLEEELRSELLEPALHRPVAA